MAKKTTTATSSTPAAKVVAKRSSTKKQPHPLRGKFDANKKPIATSSWPFETLPADFSHKLHSPLVKKDFKSEAGFFDYLASIYDKKATDLRAKAESSRTMGTGEDRKSAKRLEALAAQSAALVAKLSGKLGADVVAKIVAAAKAKAEEAAKATAVAG